MKYKGYTAVLKLDEEEKILFGRIIGLRDVITFQAESVPQAIEEFHTSVDTYLELCRSRQQSPEKPYSGNFMVRVDPELHRRIATWAQVESVSINWLVASLIRHACARRGRTANVMQRVTPEEIAAKGENHMNLGSEPAAALDEEEQEGYRVSVESTRPRFTTKAKSRKLSQPQPPKKREAKAARHKPKAPKR